MDTYSGVNSPDLNKIHIKFTKEDGSTLPNEEFTPTDWNNWEYVWDLALIHLVFILFKFGQVILNFVDMILVNVNLWS